MIPPITEVASALSRIVEDELGVNPNYRHGPKHFAPADPLELPNALFKWYSLGSASYAVPDDVTQLARAQMARTPPEARGLGFVILHRCGADFYFLLITTWRNENELWQTVWYKNGDAMEEFALWPRDEAHKPTFCVWELAPVWHEVGAWNRFLRSARDAAAAEVWLRDQVAGDA